MSNLIRVLENKLQGKGATIVLPEGNDERVLSAAVALKESGFVTPIVLGGAEVMDLASQLNLSLEGIEVIDPKASTLRDELIEKFVERRNGKATKEQAEQLLLDANYFGTMLVYTNRADGLVSGAAHSTADTVRPALQIIKTKPGVKRTSGAMCMIRGEEQYLMADIAINPTLDAESLAEIAIESAKTAESFGMNPRVAMLSFSTKGSAKSDETTKVAQATELAQTMAKEQGLSILIDGEFQFDAAFVPSVAAKKAPDALIQGNANVFVFPSLEAGNIGYKIAQRLGGFEAVGPVLQGLNAPVNDLSRGCSKEDVYNLSIITAAQSL